MLLHGLGRSACSMKALARALDDAGYATRNFSYPSRKYEIEELAEIAITAVLPQRPPNATIHFVTHSLGGILVRQYASVHTIKNLGRVVMLGPPNKGSEIVDRLGRLPGFRLLNGNVSVHMGTNSASAPNRLGAAAFDLGVIAGTRSADPIMPLLLPKPNDGRVSVESTKLEGMTDHLTLPVTHTFMTHNKQVIAQVLYFLENGRFQRGHIPQ